MKIKIIFSLAALLPLLLNLSGQDAKETTSLRAELEKLVSLQDLPAYGKGAGSLQFSSYDRTGGNDDGFGGTYSYIRRMADSSLLVFEAGGKGVIHRIWTPTPSSDSLDFYLGDTVQPAFTLAFSDLFSGRSYPFVQPLCGNELGGYYAYLPIPFDRGCRIVFRGKVMQFIQIQYSALPADAQVKPFALPLDRGERDAMDRLSTRWEKRIIPEEGEAIQWEDQKLSLAPGSSSTIFSADGGGRILGLELTPASGLAGIEKLVDVRISYDGEEVPAIHAPLADLFGFAFGRPSMQSLVAGTCNDTAYFYLPMPFDRKASIELIHREDGAAPALDFQTRVCWSDKRRDRKEEGKLYAQWNRVPVSKEGVPLTMAKVSGKGHYVGTIMQTQNLVPGMTLFFEGDDMAVVDGDTVIHGTGSEDYFNGGWYAFLDTWDRAMSLPLHGSLDYSLTYGRTGGYRWHLGDKIHFQHSLDYSMEHGPAGNLERVSNTTLGFYYCDSPRQKGQVPDNALSQVEQPGTFMLYPQTTPMQLWIEAGMTTEWCGPSGGYTYILGVSDESKARISLDEIPEGRYKLYLDYKAAPGGCMVSFWQRQHPLGNPVDTHAPEKTRVGKAYICELKVGSGMSTLTFQFQTTAERNQFFFNRLILERIDPLK